MGRYTKYQTRFCEEFPKFKMYLAYSRFVKHFVIGSFNECWEWQGKTTRRGYGIFHWRDKDICRAHVASYILFVGKIPKRYGKKKTLCLSLL